MLMLFIYSALFNSPPRPGNVRTIFKAERGAEALSGGERRAEERMLLRRPTTDNCDFKDMNALATSSI